MGTSMLSSLGMLSRAHGTVAHTTAQRSASLASRRLLLTALLLLLTHPLAEVADGLAITKLGVVDAKCAAVTIDLSVVYYLRGSFTIVNPLSVVMLTPTYYFHTASITITHDVATGAACALSPLHITHSYVGTSSWYLFYFTSLNLRFSMTPRSVVIGSPAYPLTFRGESSLTATMCGSLTLFSLAVYEAVQSGGGYRYYYPLTDIAFTCSASVINTSSSSQPVLAIQSYEVYSSPSAIGFSVSSLSSLPYAVEIGALTLVSRLTLIGASDVRFLAGSRLSSAVVSLRSPTGSTYAETLRIDGPWTVLDSATIDMTQSRTRAIFYMTGVRFSENARMTFTAPNDGSTAGSAPCSQDTQKVLSFSSLNITASKSTVTGASLTVLSSALDVMVVNGTTMSIPTVTFGPLGSADCASNFTLGDGSSIASTAFSFTPAAVGIVDLNGVLVSSSTTIHSSYVGGPRIIDVMLRPAATSSASITISLRSDADAVRLWTGMPRGNVLVSIVGLSVCNNGSVQLEPAAATDVSEPGALQLIATNVANLLIGSDLSLAKISITWSPRPPAAACALDTILVGNNVRFLGGSSLIVNGATPLSMAGVSFEGANNVLRASSLYLRNITGSANVLSNGGATLSVVSPCGDVALEGALRGIHAVVQGARSFVVRSGTLSNHSNVTVSLCDVSNVLVNLTRDGHPVTLEDSTLGFVDATAPTQLGGTMEICPAHMTRSMLVVSPTAATNLSTRFLCGTIVVDSSIVRLVDSSIAGMHMITVGGGGGGIHLLNGSSFAMSAKGALNDLGGFQRIDNATVELHNRNSDRDILSFLSSSSLLVRGGRAHLVGKDAIPTSLQSSASLSLRGAVWGSGSTVYVDAPMLVVSLQGTMGSVTVASARMRALALEDNLVLEGCALNLSSGLWSLDNGTTVGRSVVLNRTAMVWSLRYVEGIASVLSSLSSAMFSALRLSAVACSSQCPTLQFRDGTMPFASTSLDVVFTAMPTSAAHPNVSVVGLSPTSHLSVRSAGFVAISGSFSGNSTVAIEATRGATVSYETLRLTDNVTFLLTLNFSGTAAATSMPCTPKQIVGGSRLEILAANATNAAGALWAVLGSGIGDGGSVYLHVPRMDVQLAQLTNVGSVLTIVSNTLTTSGAAFAPGVTAVLDVRSPQMKPRALELNSTQKQGYENLSLSVRVTSPLLADHVVVGHTMRDSNISVFSAECTIDCGSKLVIDGSLMFRSAVAVHVLGRFVEVRNMDIPDRRNSVVASVEKGTVSGRSLVDVNIELTVNVTSTSQGPRSSVSVATVLPTMLTRSNLTLTLAVGIINTHDRSFTVSDNALFRALLANVTLAESSAMRLVATLHTNGAPNSISVRNNEVFPVPLTVNPARLKQGAILHISDDRSHVQILKGIGDAAHSNVSVTVSCNTVSLRGSFTNTSSVTIAAGRVAVLSMDRVENSRFLLSVANVSNTSMWFGSFIGAHVMAVALAPNTNDVRVIMEGPVLDSNATIWLGRESTISLGNPLTRSTLDVEGNLTGMIGTRFISSNAVLRSMLLATEVRSWTYVLVESTVHVQLNASSCIMSCLLLVAGTEVSNGSLLVVDAHTELPSRVVHITLTNVALETGGSIATRLALGPSSASPLNLTVRNVSVGPRGGVVSIAAFGGKSAQESAEGNCTSTWNVSGPQRGSGGRAPQTARPMAQRAGECLLEWVLSGDLSKTVMRATIENNGTRLPGLPARTTLEVDSMGPGGTVALDCISSLHLKGTWSSGTRLGVRRLEDTIGLNGSLAGANVDVEGADGAQLVVAVHGVIGDHSTVIIQEHASSPLTAPIALTWTARVVLTASVQNASSVHLSGMNRQWYPGTSSVRLRELTSFLHLAPLVGGESEMYAQSIHVSAIALSPAELGTGSTLTVSNVSVGLWLPSAGVPQMVVPLNVVEPSWTNLDDRIDPTEAIFTFAAATVRVPPGAVGAVVIENSSFVIRDNTTRGNVSTRFRSAGLSVVHPGMPGNSSAWMLLLRRCRVEVDASGGSTGNTVVDVVLPGAVTSVPSAQSVLIEDVVVNVTLRASTSFSFLAIRPQEVVSSTETRMEQRRWSSITPVSNQTTRCVATNPNATSYDCTTNHTFTVVVRRVVARPSTNHSILNLTLMGCAIWGTVTASTEAGPAISDLVFHGVSLRDHYNRTVHLTVQGTAMALEGASSSSQQHAVLVFLRNENVSSTTKRPLLSNGAAAFITIVETVVLDIVLVEVFNVFLQSIAVLNGSRVEQRRTNSTISAAILAYTYLPASSALVTAFDTLPIIRIEGTYVVVSGSPPMPAVVLVSLRPSASVDPPVHVSSRTSAALATSTSAPRMSVEFETSMFSGVSALLSTESSGDPTSWRLDEEGVTAAVLMCSVECSGGSSTSVVNLSPHDAFSVKSSVSSFRSCGTFLRGGDSSFLPIGGVTAHWACNEWNSRFLSRALIRGLLTPSRVFGTPDILAKFGEINCRSTSVSISTTTSKTRWTISRLGTPSDLSMTASASASQAVSLSDSQTSSRSFSESLSATHTRSSTASVTTTTTTTLNVSITRGNSSSQAVSGSRTGSFSGTLTSSTSNDGKSVSASSSRTVSQSSSPSDTVSSSSTISKTQSSSLSPTSTTSGTPSITIDPCNTTFRDDSDNFIRKVSLLTDISSSGAFFSATLNDTQSTFLTLDRVLLATVKILRVQFGFNTFLRNFYYNTSLDWFPLPTVENCHADGFELVNATDMIVRIAYDPDVSLSHGVDEPYFCNLTFSTDIFQCQLMTNFTFNFSATVLVTGTPQLLTPAGAFATQLTTTMITLLSGGAALLQQSRAQSLSELSSCQFSLVDEISVQDSPLQFGFGSELQHHHRGCVVGNVLFVIVFGTAVFVLALAAACTCRREVEVWGKNDQASIDDDIAPTAECLDSIHSDGSMDDELCAPPPPDPEDPSIHGLALELPDADSDDADDSVGDDPDIVSPAPADACRDGGLPPAQSSTLKLDASTHGVLDDHCVDQRFPIKGNLKLVDRRQEYFLEALPRYCGLLAFPSIMLLPLLLLADSTVLSAVRLLVHPVDPHDVAIGSVGISIYVLCLVACAVYTTTFVRRAPRKPRLRKTHPLAAYSKSLLARSLIYWLMPTTEYTPLQRRDRHVHAMMRLLFEDSRYPAFVCCDLALSLLIASIVGVGISRREVCSYLAVVGASGYVAFFGAVLWLRPDLSRLSLVLNACGAALGLCSAMLTLVSMFESNPQLGMVNQYLGLVMMGISMLQFVATAVAIVWWVKSVGIVVLLNPKASELLGRHSRPLTVLRDINGNDADTLDGGSSDRSDDESQSTIREPSTDSDSDILGVNVESAECEDDDEEEEELFTFPANGTGEDMDGLGLLLENSNRADASGCGGTTLDELFSQYSTVFNKPRDDDDLERPAFPTVEGGEDLDGLALLDYCSGKGSTLDDSATGTFLAEGMSDVAQVRESRETTKSLSSLHML